VAVPVARRLKFEKNDVVLILEVAKFTKIFIPVKVFFHH